MSKEEKIAFIESLKNLDDTDLEKLAMCAVGLMVGKGAIVNGLNNPVFDAVKAG